MYAYLGLGTNLGNRLLQLRQAIALLQASVGQVEQQSSVYESAAMYVSDQPAFHNMVVRVTTPLAPLDLLPAIKRIESHLGRDNQRTSQRYGPRPIDIDIELITLAALPQHVSDWMIIDAPDLHIPHLQLSERAFVLQPLHELLPANTFTHPRTYESLVTLLARTADQDCRRIGPLGDTI